MQLAIRNQENMLTIFPEQRLFELWKQTFVSLSCALHVKFYNTELHRLCVPQKKNSAVFLNIQLKVEFTVIFWKIKLYLNTVTFGMATVTTQMMLNQFVAK